MNQVTQIAAPELIDTRAVAQMLGFSLSHVRKIAYGDRPAPKGFPPALRVGKSIRYRRRDLLRYIDSLGASPQAQAVSDPDPSPDPLPEPTPARPRGRPRKQPASRAQGGAA